MSTPPFTGTWQLQSWTALKNGTPSGYPMGEDAEGQIIYAEDGFMCAFLMRADFAAKNGPAAAETCLSYGGKWSFAEGRIAHQVSFSSLPHWIGRKLIRNVDRKGDLMTLRTEVETSKSGTRYEHVLVWKRAVS
ncbi:lipocalin-like domain-containing protein [uncultured Shimia sp.]|uniref:lipocalin-like domain-containing protein n=1 Tax=uncultured Shimia sp. TaxID=573152 RepID=UPI0025DD8916|nr:lipocalin-like domain-containing protein [uncultured Shimia sp.]